MTYKVTTSSPEETQLFGMKLGELLSKSDVVLLYGELGAGKTLLTKGIALGLDVADYVSSPTYMLINEYEGLVPVYHMDLYRLNGVVEAIDLGLDEYFYGRGVTLVEWPERIQELLPDEYLAVRIAKLGDEERELTIEAQGTRYTKLVEALARGVE